MQQRQTVIGLLDTCHMIKYARYTTAIHPSITLPSRRPDRCRWRRRLLLVHAKSIFGLVHHRSRVFILVAGKSVAGLLGVGFLRLGLTSRGTRLSGE